MKTIIALACLTALSAHATNYPPTPTTTNQAGAIAGAAALSRSSVRNTSMTTSAGGAGGSATGGAASITGLMNMQGATLGGGGAGGAGGFVGEGAGALNLSGARIGSDVTMERSAPPIYAPQPTAGGLRTCPKPGFSVGGSGSGGGGVLSASFGSDTTCRVEQALGIMAMDPSLYDRDDRLTVACKQEDIAETRACKDLAKRQAAPKSAVVPAPAEVTQTRQPMPWQAGG